MGLLTERVAVITGSSTPQGIGSAIARRYAQEGASLYLVAEGTPEQLEQVRKECRSQPDAGRVECGIFDLGQRGAAESMIEDAVQRFGRVDILVNNAAIRAQYDFEDYTRDIFDRVIAVNLAAPFFASQAAVRVMRRQGGGRIINIASQLARVTYAKRALYGLTKAALVHLTKSMAYELARHGIVVNSISPGPIKTQFVMDRDAADPEGAKQRLRTYVPIGRLGEPWEIAEAALFLASTPATFLQGEDICVDGGYTAH